MTMHLRKISMIPRKISESKWNFFLILALRFLRFKFYTLFVSSSSVNASFLQVGA